MRFGIDNNIKFPQFSSWLEYYFHRCVIIRNHILCKEELMLPQKQCSNIHSYYSGRFSMWGHAVILQDYIIILSMCLWHLGSLHTLRVFQEWNRGMCPHLYVLYPTTSLNPLYLPIWRWKFHHICGVSKSFSDFNEMQALKVFICHLVLSVTPDAWFIGVLHLLSLAAAGFEGEFSFWACSPSGSWGIQSHGPLACFHENCIYYKRVIVNK